MCRVVQSVFRNRVFERRKNMICGVNNVRISSRGLHCEQSLICLCLACEQALCLGKNSEEREGKGGEAFPSPHPARLKACVQRLVFAKLLHPKIKDVSLRYCKVTSWFAIALAEMRTRRILRENADCKQSKCGPTSLVTGSGW